MSIIKQAYFDFFQELAANNNRDWFLANKNRYENDVKEPFLLLVEKIVASLSDTEPELALLPVKNMLFRINRDIRFSKDKEPYKSNLGATITKYGTKNKSYPGHYIQFGQGATESFIAGGPFWFEEKETLLRVRNFIAAYPERFAELIDNKDFKSKWGEIRGKKNKRIPPEFVEDAKLQPLIANTQFYWSAGLTKELLLSDNIVEILRGYWLAAQPLNEFFKEAMYS